MSYKRMILMTCCGVAAFALVACGNSKQTSDSSALTEQVGAAADAVSETVTDAVDQLRELSGTESTLVERVAKIAKSIEATPDNAVAILEENGFTADQWSKTMEDIAADPALSAAYEVITER